MALEKQYQPGLTEPALEARWQSEGVYRFDAGGEKVFAIDTPPPTVSGKLHLGHIYSYSHADFIARYRRMRGDNVYYPMGFDDNGLPTERLVERTIGKSARDVAPAFFVEECTRISAEAEEEYKALFHSLGLSVDWRYTYRTISPEAQRCSQHSFLDLYNKGLAYRALAPAIWCPECRASFAQADLEDRQRQSEYVTLPFLLEDGAALRIATTRPELLAACVAVFVHPSDARYREWIGRSVRVPLYGQSVAVLADAGADPEKGTGAVMCCTFGDQADVSWQRAYHLAIIEAIDAAGRMTAAARIPDEHDGGGLEGLPAGKARQKINEILAERGLILARQPTDQSVRVHERCETPVEYRMVSQWFIRVLEYKDKFLELGDRLRWYPEQMGARYRAWVENLNWDWSISRQRYFGVPIPAWYCRDCGEVITAEAEELPVAPRQRGPERACRCGSREFIPETDVMDTWATSSVSPLIASGWLEDPQRFERLFPMTLRPNAHEIIRTWVFYTVVKAWHHFGKLPWEEVLVSGWALAGEGMAKISKSKGGGPMTPQAMLRKYSADALRYWAASSSTGKDTLISEEKIQMGMKLATKLWNVARFAAPFIAGAEPAQGELTPADRWMRAGCARLCKQVTAAFDQREYALARAEIESYFWRDLADNYLEMIKQRLYQAGGPDQAAAGTLRLVFECILKLLAPLLPYVTEAIWLELYAPGGLGSIHRAAWPDPSEISARIDDQDWSETDVYAFGGDLIEIASAARRYKSEHALSLGSPLTCLGLATDDARLAERLRAAGQDLLCITRAQELWVGEQLPDEMLELEAGLPGLRVAIAR